MLHTHTHTHTRLVLNILREFVVPVVLTPNPHHALPSSWLLQCKFKISGFATSGLKVSKLDITGEKYKPFKGVTYMTVAGRYDVRC